MAHSFTILVLTDRVEPDPGEQDERQEMSEDRGLDEFILARECIIALAKATFAKNGRLVIEADDGVSSLIGLIGSYYSSEEESSLSRVVAYRQTGGIGDEQASPDADLEKLGYIDLHSAENKSEFLREASQRYNLSAIVCIRGESKYLDDEVRTLLESEGCPEVFFVPSTGGFAAALREAKNATNLEQKFEHAERESLHPEDHRTDAYSEPEFSVPAYGFYCQKLVESLRAG